eukprot:jgi/Phyca11/14686/fgenesh1_pg.PHYCAscaffold_9_\
MLQHAVVWDMGYVAAADLGNSYGKCVMPSMIVPPLLEFQNDPDVALRRVPFVDVSLVRQITSGAYGEVWLGRLRGDIVAVKRLTRERRRQNVLIRDNYEAKLSDFGNSDFKGEMATGGYDVDYAALGLTEERFEAFKSVFSALDKTHTARA